MNDARILLLCIFLPPGLNDRASKFKDTGKSLQAQGLGNWTEEQFTYGS